MEAAAPGPWRHHPRRFYRHDEAGRWGSGGSRAVATGRRTEDVVVIVVVWCMGRAGVGRGAGGSVGHGGAWSGISIFVCAVLPRGESKAVARTDFFCSRRSFGASRILKSSVLQFVVAVDSLD